MNWRERAPELAPMGDDGEQRLALIFGSEESGLTREEAAVAQELAHLRTAPEHTLNLAQAVMVVPACSPGTRCTSGSPSPSAWISASGRFSRSG